MRNIRKKVLYGMFVMLAAAMCMTSCGKDDDNEGGGTTGGGSSSTTGGSGTLWTPAKKLKKIELSLADHLAPVVINYTWDGDRLVKVTRTCEEQSLVNMESFFVTGSVGLSYNSSKQLTSVSHTMISVASRLTWEGNSISTEYAAIGEYLTLDYKYSNGKLKELSYQGYPIPVSWSGNNVAKSVTDMEGKYEYTYDNKPNPLHIPAGLIYSEIGTLLMPHTYQCWSENNITSVKCHKRSDGEDKLVEVKYTYTYDADGFPLTMTSEGYSSLEDGFGNISATFTYNE